MPPKRKSSQTDGAADADVQPRRSTRQRTSTTHAREAAEAGASAAPKKNAKKPAAPVKKAAPKAKRKGKQGDEDGDDSERQAAPPAGGKAGKTNGVKVEKKPPTKSTAEPTAGEIKPNEVKDAGRQYWLMKAEPESRIENGVDVKFSIDDLAAKKEPEPWDGMFLILSCATYFKTDKTSMIGIRNFVGMDCST